MTEFASKVHPGMLGDPGLKNPDLTLIRTDMVDDYYGIFGRGLIQKVRTGYSCDEEIDILTLGAQYPLDRVDAIFFQRLASRHDLEGPRHAQEVYLNQLRHANQVPMYVLEQAMPQGLEDVYGLRNEIALLCDSPAELLALASHCRDPIEQFELQRQMLLAELSLHFHIKARDEQLYRRLRSIQGLLNKELFQFKDESRTTPINILSIHDNLTNEYRGQMGKDLDYQDIDLNTHHRKQLSFQARWVDGIGNVMTQPRKKRDQVSIMKALQKASRRDGQVNLEEDVTDSTGIVLVALGDDTTPGTVAHRDALAERTLSSLHQRYGDSIRIIEDHVLDGRTTSKGLNWLRYQVYFEGSQYPLEMVLYDQKGYIDSRLKVGDLSNDKEKDRAHGLYEVKRAQMLFDLLFPRSIYNGKIYEDIDRDQLMAEKIESTAKSLRSSRRVDLNGEDMLKGISFD